MRISLPEAYSEYQKYFNNVEQFVRFILDNNINVYLSREALVGGLPLGKPSLSLGDRIQDRQSYMLKYFQSEIDDLCINTDQFHNMWVENLKRFSLGMTASDFKVVNLGELEICLSELFISPKEFVLPLIKDDKFEVEIQVPDKSCSSLIIKLGQKESIVEDYGDFAANILRVMINRYMDKENRPCTQEDIEVKRAPAHFRKSSAFGGKYIQNFVTQKDGLLFKPRVQFS